ncbi:apolipoprotein N-acyltransferase, partial [Treponema sp.]|uniref:apolipoprotein N-acyltransferase n=1 Tax=Treponema sp. TaxID=166 RepID=UPI00388DF3D2
MWRFLLQRSKNFLLLFLSVFLFLLSNPSFLCEDGISFLSWVCYFPLFLLLDRISLKKSFLYGFAYGFISYILLCWYLSSFGFAALSFVSFLFGFYYSVLFFILIWAKIVFPSKYRNFFWLFRIFILISFDLLRSRGIFGFSYGITGYTQWKNPVFLRFSSLFGVNGVSFLIYLFNSLIYELLIFKNKQISAFFSIFPAVFIFYLFPYQTTEKSELNIALIQNSSSASSNSISDFENDALLLKNLTDKALEYSPETELVVWPETAIVPDIIYHSENFSDSRRHRLAVDLIDYFKEKKCAFLTGNNHIAGKRNYNSAVFFHPDNKNFEIYSKNHLVPFTEFWPSFLDFKFFDFIKKRLNCEFFSMGNEISVFKIGGLIFASPICFEDSFSPLICLMKEKDADFLINISDDAWSNCKEAQKIHLSMSVFRAAEYNSPVIRSTIDGITCIIDCHGKVISYLKSGTDSFLTHKLGIPKNSKTMYFYIRDYPFFLILIFTIILLLIFSVQFV